MGARRAPGGPRKPSSLGSRPDRSVAWEGRVSGTWDIALPAYAPSRADPIESGCDVHAAVHADAVRPQGVDRDENEVAGSERWPRCEHAVEAQSAANSAPVGQPGRWRGRRRFAVPPFSMAAIVCGDLGRRKTGVSRVRKALTLQAQHCYTPAFLLSAFVFFTIDFDRCRARAVKRRDRQPCPLGILAFERLPSARSCS
jgi:hypothetical protein